MNPSNELELILVFAAFQLACGAALGQGLRSLVVEHDLEGLGSGLWGLAAGTILSIVSVALALGAGQPLLAAGSVALFLLAALFSWAVLPHIFHAVGAGVITGVGFGSVFMLTGLAVAANGLRVRDTGSLLAGGVFFVVGALIAWAALGPMLRGEPPQRV